MTKFLFKENVELKSYTTYGIGGPAKEFCEISSIDEMQEVICHLSSRGKRFMILGKGSNCLFDDKGFDGTVILNKISFINWGELNVSVGAGYSFSLLGSQSARKSLHGLEFAAGIPASVGGAVYMNAGANGVEVQNVLANVDYVDEKGDRHLFSRESLTFDYRTSPFQKMKGAIVAASFNLMEKEGVQEKQKEIVEYRMLTQPLKEKSCGCVFRNPENKSAGKVIQECDLTSFSINGATISDVHRNFIVNKGGATSKDVLQVIEHIQKVVFDKTGIHLQPEVKVIPFKESDARVL